MSDQLIKPARQVVQVAVGVIVRNEQVLICWRDASLHQGNRYEFPGGKLESGESALQALSRELAEEINIEVRHAVRAQRLDFDYPEKTVCLHVFKVTRFTGEPRGQQGQAVLWVNRQDLGRYQFPDANTPILRMLGLPKYYVIAQPQHDKASPVQALDPAARPLQTLQQWLDWHIQHIPQQAWFYLRHPQLTAPQYQQVVEQLLNQRPDLRLVVMYQQAADLKPVWAKLAGVHFRQSDVIQTQDHGAFPAHWYRFAACHDALSIERANALAVDAILLSPLHTTNTHAGEAALGWQAWQQLAALSKVPVYALGGMSPQDLPKVQAAGGFGVAGIRAFYCP